MSPELSRLLRSSLDYPDFSGALWTSPELSGLLRSSLKSPSPIPPPPGEMLMACHFCRPWAGTGHRGGPKMVLLAAAQGSTVVTRGPCIRSRSRVGERAPTRWPRGTAERGTLPSPLAVLP
eukprot:5908713-Alexandrium_andersonii.AAC.1